LSLLRKVAEKNRAKNIFGICSLAKTHKGIRVRGSFQNWLFPSLTVQL
jgi:hypothetical protein